MANDRTVTARFLDDFVDAIIDVILDTAFQRSTLRSADNLRAAARHLAAHLDRRDEPDHLSSAADSAAYVADVVAVYSAPAGQRPIADDEWTYVGSVFDFDEHAGHLLPGYDAAGHCIGAVFVAPGDRAPELYGAVPAPEDRTVVDPAADAARDRSSSERVADDQGRASDDELIAKLLDAFDAIKIRHRIGPSIIPVPRDLADDTIELLTKLMR